MEISWEVEDGYVGGSRPQSFLIDDDEIQECETEQDALKLIEEYTQDDFESKITWCYRNFSSMEDEIRNLLEGKTGCGGDGRKE